MNGTETSRNYLEIYLKVDIERTVEFYCIAMETFKICRNNYNLNVHEIRYEDLINNFQSETEAVLRFLNLQWEPEMENYQDTALNRGYIKTPKLYSGHTANIQGCKISMA